MVKPYFRVQKDNETVNGVFKVQKTPSGRMVHTVNSQTYDSAIEAARKVTKRIIEQNRENFLRNYKV
jgi:hypothetical protein